MLAVRQRHGELGAIHVQQDLYDQIMVMAALQLGDMPRMRQLLKARLSTRIWDSQTWHAYEDRLRRVDEARDAAAVHAALLRNRKRRLRPIVVTIDGDVTLRG